MEIERESQLNMRIPSLYSLLYSLRFKCEETTVVGDRRRMPATGEVEVAEYEERMAT